MKFFFILLLMSSSILTTCQNAEKIILNDLKTKTFRDLNRLNGYESYYLIKRINLGKNFYCAHYQDTILNNQLITSEEKTQNFTYSEYEIKDLILIKDLKSNEYIQFGSIEILSEDFLIVAVEKLENTTLPINSLQIQKAWIFNIERQNFQKIDIQNLYRLNEGYYYAN